MDCGGFKGEREGLEGCGDGDAEKDVTLRELVGAEFEVDEGFDECAGGGFGEVDDGASGAVPAAGVVEAAFARKGAKGADAPQVAQGWGAQAKKPLWIWPSISSTRRPPTSVRSMSMGVRPSKRRLDWWSQAAARGASPKTAAAWWKTRARRASLSDSSRERGSRRARRCFRVRAGITVS